MALGWRTPEANENRELNSTKKLCFSDIDLIHPEKNIIEQLGYVTIKNGNITIHSASEDYYNFLVRIVERMWIPQRGIPCYKKTASGEYEKNEKGYLIVDRYVIPGQVTPDEFLEVIRDYENAVGRLTTRFEDL